MRLTQRARSGSRAQPGYETDLSVGLGEFGGGAAAGGVGGLHGVVIVVAALAVLAVVACFGETLSRFRPDPGLSATANEEGFMALGEGGIPFA